MTAEPEKPAPAARHAATSPVRPKGDAVIATVLRLLPGPIRRKMETEAGKRFSRFIPVAVAAVVSSQVTLAILTGVNMSAGKAALCASIVGAAVSYLLSRWAWERKGRPDLLRETVPFWLLSFAVWGILSLVTHYAGAYALHHNLHHLQKHLVVQGTYFAANCVTFVLRFLIIHYVLFADRRRQAETAGQTTAQAPAEAPKAAGPAAEALGNGSDAQDMALTADSTGPLPRQN
jgi:putative flippase GtrA